MGIYTLYPVWIYQTNPLKLHYRSLPGNTNPVWTVILFHICIAQVQGCILARFMKHKLWWEMCCTAGSTTALHKYSHMDPILSILIKFSDWGSNCTNDSAQLDRWAGHVWLFAAMLKCPTGPKIECLVFFLMNLITNYLQIISDFAQHTFQMNHPERMTHNNTLNWPRSHSDLGLGCLPWTESEAITLLMIKQSGAVCCAAFRQ